MINNLNRILVQNVSEKRQKNIYSRIKEELKSFIRKPESNKNLPKITISDLVGINTLNIPIVDNEHQES